MNDQALTLNQYLTFNLDEELYALDIASVREILEMTFITRIPRVPEFMRGVINLRGRAVPVVDLRLKFGMGRTEKTVDTCIIITEVDLDGEKLVVGALADSVQEVVEIVPEAIEPAPRMGTSIRSEFIRGMGRHGERFIIVLDASRVFSSQELTALGDLADQPEDQVDAA
jgi:purine-binding chemotaxis protein CheW